MQLFYLSETLVLHADPLDHFTTAAYVPAGESILLFLLWVHPHLEFVPHLHSPVFRSLSLPYVDDALLLLRLNDATRAVPYIREFSRHFRSLEYSPVKRFFLINSLPRSVPCIWIKIKIRDFLSRWNYNSVVHRCVYFASAANIFVEEKSKIVFNLFSLFFFYYLSQISYISLMNAHVTSSEIVEPKKPLTGQRIPSPYVTKECRIYRESKQSYTCISSEAAFLKKFQANA